MDSNQHQLYIHEVPLLSWYSPPTAWYHKNSSLPQRPLQQLLKSSLRNWVHHPLLWREIQAMSKCWHCLEPRRCQEHVLIILPASVGTLRLSFAQFDIRKIEVSGADQFGSFYHNCLPQRTDFHCIQGILVSEDLTEDTPDLSPPLSSNGYWTYELRIAIPFYPCP